MRKDKPSMTARKVGLTIVALGAKRGMDSVLPPGIVEATEKILVASGVVGERAVRWSRSKIIVSVYEAFDWMLPGQFVAFAHRKAFCERQVRDGIDAGATQILGLGAGYDTLGWRLAPEFPGVNFFEIDHPTTALLKAKGIDVMGRHNNLCLMAEDLSKRKLMDVLFSEESWDTSAQTIIIAEGLVMYLQDESVEDLLRQCAAMIGEDSRIVFSYIPSGTDGRPDVGKWTSLMLWLQKLIGEPWLWSIHPGELERFLEQLGWSNAPVFSGTGVNNGVEFYVVAKRQ